MKLTLLVAIRGGRNLDPGDVAEFEEGEARRMIASRFAVPFVESRIETAAKKPVAEKRKAKK